MKTPAMAQPMHYQGLIQYPANTTYDTEFFAEYQRIVSMAQDMHYFVLYLEYHGVPQAEAAEIVLDIYIPQLHY